jgi:hypothetical protein
MRIKVKIRELASRRIIMSEVAVSTLERGEVTEVT